MQAGATTEFSPASGQALAGLYEAFAQGDIDTVISTVTDDIEWRVNGPSPVAGTYRGKEAVLGFFSRMMAPYEGTLRVDVVAMLADDHYGLVRVAERAERPGDGVAYSGIHAWEFRDGRCSRFESYYDDTYAEFWSARSN
jgi:ketosteroid isomerase-like protein